jgi:exosortase A-associated hydrolase 2
MQPAAAGTVVEPFFLPVGPGRRFCVFRGPAPGSPCRRAFVHVPAFAEEMNKSRRMTAMQARAFAEQGIATVQIDLFGTGDSDGDFRDARWDIWAKDVIAAAEWLRRRAECEVGLWGLRLGALLAAEVLHEGGMRSDTLVLWQPVTSGELFLTQFLRLKVASAMLAGDTAGADTRRMRESLARGEPLEIGGYELSPELAKALDSRRLAALSPAAITKCTWLEVSTAAGDEPSPASRRVLAAWHDAGVTANVRSVAGEPFWATTEIVENSTLIDETLKSVMDLT